VTHETTVSPTGHAALPYRWICSCGQAGRRYATRVNAERVGVGHQVAEAAAEDAASRCGYPVLGAW